MIPIPLPGCAPVPLAHYLKALGVLRLVSAHFPDGRVQGAWRDDQFVLQGEGVDGPALVHFLLHDYEPTPIFAPWNAGSGFYFREATETGSGKKVKTGVRNVPTAATQVVTDVIASKAERLAHYRRSLGHAKEALAALGRIEAPKDEEKADLILRLRNTVADDVLIWFDAAFVLTGSGVSFPPLLGTGGNGGNMDFTSNFMQRLAEVFDFTTGKPTAASERWLGSALFGTAIPQVPASAFGQFSPGGGGGFNAGPGFNGGAAVNPWDFILMIEGALLFAIASVKRLGAAGDGSLASPFTVRKAGVGYASSALADEEDPRGETWMPLWHQPIGLAELQALLGEGRAQVGGRAARTGVDLMRAAVSLGVDRGIASFQRFGFHKRNGDLHFAVPLDRVPVRRNEKVDLLTDVETFLDRFRSKAASTNPPAPGGIARALRALEESIYALCRSGEAGNIQRVLIALGGCERAMARSLRWTQETGVLKPITGLSPRWLVEAYDHTWEFRIAAALAAIGGRYGTDWLPLRAHLEPVQCGVKNQKSWSNWAEDASPDVVWHEGDLIDVLNHAFARRLVRAQQAGLDALPDHEHARIVLPLADIAVFITADAAFDQRVDDLLWGLSLITFHEPFSTPWPVQIRDQDESPPAFYALLRLAFAGNVDPGEAIKLQPGIHARAARAANPGDVLRASEMAARRLRASSVRPAIERAPLDPRAARRAAAALLIPLTTTQTDALRKAVMRPEPAEATAP